MAEYPTDDTGALRPNDPYRGMERQDTRPKLGTVEGGNPNSASKASQAKLRLAGAEESASARSISATSGGSNEAKAAEQNQPFTSRVEGRKKDEEKAKAKGFFRNKGPLIALISLLLGGGGLMLGSQTLMPFALASRIVQEFNSMKTVMSGRSDSMLRFQLDTERYKNPTRTTIFGNEKFNLSKAQIKKLKTEGIDFMSLNVNGKKVKLLVYDDGSGKKQPILTDTDIKKVDADALDLAIKAESPDIEIKSSAVALGDAFDDFDGFRNGYLKSSKTWKGNIAGWFDSVVLKVLDRLNIGRNRFKKWQTASDIESGNSKFKEAITQKNQIEDEVSDGRKLTETDDPDSGGLREEGVDTGDRISSDDSILNKKNAQALQKALESKVVKVAQAAANVTCAYFSATGAIHGIVAAAQAAQFVDLVSGFLEARDKVMAGDGNSSPLTYYANALSTKDPNTGVSAMQAQGISALFSRININSSDTSVSAVNSESLMSKIKIMGMEAQFAADDFMKCAYAQGISAGIGIVVDILGVFTGGIASIFKGIAKSIAMSTVMSVVLPFMLSSIIPVAAEMIKKDILSDFVGEDLGNALVSGSNKYLGGNHQGGGGSPGDSDTVLAYRRETERILAEEAEYDRQTKSPFDLSSQNTFLGSLAYQMMSLSTNLSGVTGIIFGISGTVASSVTSLLPSASAIADTDLIVSQGDCPVLESINIMGDAYCNPYYTSDLSTAGLDPGQDVFETVANLRVADYKKVYSPLQSDASLCRVESAAEGTYWQYQYPTNFKYLEENHDDPSGCMLDVELDEELNPIINANSALGQYIIFCGQRSSAWGLADGNIASQMQQYNINTGVGGLDNILEGVVGAIPFVGDAKDALEAASNVQNAPWVSGQACVASGSNELWSENKYYQRYSEDQRWMESAGIIEESATVAVLDQYYESFPVDNSYEGVLSRYSGMTKEQVVATIDLINYLDFLADYDATELAPLAANPKAPDVTISDHDTAPTSNFVIYSTTRERSFAA